MDQAAIFWSRMAAEHRAAAPPMGWLDSPLLQQIYVVPAIASQSGNWLADAARRHSIPRDSRWLSLGCGRGDWELYALEAGLCTQIEGVDIAPGAAAMAMAAARERGLTGAHFRVANVERERLPEAAYDVILCNMALHHVRRLEYWLAEATNALRPGGWLLCNEFIGPSRWQWTDAQLDAVNTLLAALPERYRVHPITGAVKQREERPTIEWMKHHDASESVRSAEIPALLGEFFEVIEQSGYGGAILHKLLENIVSNFQSPAPEGAELLQLLCAAERALTRAGCIGSDFALLAAQNSRTTARSSALPFDARFERHIVAGVYSVERTPHGRPFCWTSGTAHLVLERPPEARALGLVLSLPPQSSLVTVLLDDEAIGCFKTPARPQAGKWWRVECGLPRFDRHQPSIRVLVEPPYTPASSGASSDKRELGVALAAIGYR